MIKNFKIKKSVIVIAVAVLLFLVVLINVVSAMFFSFSLLKKDGWEDFEKYLYGEQLKTETEWISQKGDKIQIENSSGKLLSAIKIKNEHVSHSYVIICHQYGGSPESVVEYAQHFYDLGFNIILPYMRGHGHSQYNSISFGWEDRFDILDWVEETVKKDEKAKIALFGVSLGANAVTLAATEELPENVRLVISDSCYTSLKDLTKEYIKKQTNFPSEITTELVSAFCENKIGVRLKNADTISRLGNIELPIMFINGENDTVVPPLVSKKLYENCESEGVEEVVIEAGTHGRNLQTDEENYWMHIDTFILNNLGI